MSLLSLQLVRVLPEDIGVEQQGENSEQARGELPPCLPSYVAHKAHTLVNGKSLDGT